MTDDVIVLVLMTVRVAKYSVVTVCSVKIIVIVVISGTVAVYEVMVAVLEVVPGTMIRLVDLLT